ncbi:MAG: lipocalin family protein [Chitinophagales bacterium]|nr:lipocalin family protein [Bacteroidota bacterium]
MKTILTTNKLLLVIALFITLISCSRNDDLEIEPTTAELIAHKWFMVKTETQNPVVIHIANACGQQSYFDFTVPNQVKSENKYMLESGDCESQGVQEGVYSISKEGNDEFLLINLNGTSIQLKINSLTTSELIVTSTDGAKSFLKR